MKTLAQARRRGRAAAAAGESAKPGIRRRPLRDRAARGDGAASPATTSAAPSREARSSPRTSRACRATRPRWSRARSTCAPRCRCRDASSPSQERPWRRASSCAWCATAGGGMSAVFSRGRLSRSCAASWVLLAALGRGRRRRSGAGGKLVTSSTRSASARPRASKLAAGARRASTTARRERDNLRESADIFRTLVDRGLLQGERRLDMVELRQRAARAPPALRARLRDRAAAAAALAGGRAFAAVDVLASRVKLQLRALHEGDVLGFVEELAREPPGLLPARPLRAAPHRGASRRCAAPARRGRVHARMDHAEGKECGPCRASRLLVARARCAPARPRSPAPPSWARSSTRPRSARGSTGCAAASRSAPRAASPRPSAARRGGHRLREAQRRARHRVHRRRARSPVGPARRAAARPGKVRASAAVLPAVASSDPKSRARPLARKRRRSATSAISARRRAAAARYPCRHGIASARHPWTRRAPRRWGRPARRSRPSPGRASPARWRLSSASAASQRDARERSRARAGARSAARLRRRPADRRARRTRLPALPRPRRRRLGRGHLRIAERRTSARPSASGRLPWKTLGLPDLRDGHGERLWYAVSTQLQGPAQLRREPGVRRHEPGGGARHDHGARCRRRRACTTARAPIPRARPPGAAAVVIAPGPPLWRRDGHEQRRDCEPGVCDARGRCLAEPHGALRAATRATTSTRRSAARTTPPSTTAATPRDAPQRATASSRARSLADGAPRGERPAGAIAYADVMPRVMAARGAGGGALPARAPRQSSRPQAPCDASPALGRVADAGWRRPACSASPTIRDGGRAWRRTCCTRGRAPADSRSWMTTGGASRTASASRSLVTRAAGSCAPSRIDCDAAGCLRARQPRAARRVTMRWSPRPERAGFTLLEVADRARGPRDRRSRRSPFPSPRSCSCARVDEARRQLDDARDALLGFAAAHGRLPCPATRASRGAGGLRRRRRRGQRPLRRLPRRLPPGRGPRPGAARRRRTSCATRGLAAANRVRYAVFGGNAVNGVAQALTRANGMQHGDARGPGRRAALSLRVRLRAAAGRGRLRPGGEPAHAPRGVRAALARRQRARRAAGPAATRRATWTATMPSSLATPPRGAFDDLLDWGSDPHGRSTALVAAGRAALRGYNCAHEPARQAPADRRRAGEPRHAAARHRPGGHQGHPPPGARSASAAGGEQHTIANFNMYVGLPHHFKGTHMSRFVEILNAHEREISLDTFRRCCARWWSKLDAESGHIEMTFPYFVNKKAPVSGVQSLHGLRGHLRRRDPRRRARPSRSRCWCR